MSTEPSVDAPPPASAGDDPEKVSKGLLIVLGVVVGLAALYALYTFVVSPLLAEDEAVDDVVQSPPADVAVPDDGVPGEGSIDPAAGATPLPTPTPEILPEDIVPETFEIFTARDPFQQLVVQAEVEEVAADGTTDGTTSGGTTTGGTVTDGTVDANTGGSTTGGSTTGGSTTGGSTTGGSSTGGSSGSTGGSTGTGGGETAPSSANVGTTRISVGDVFTDDDGTMRLIVTVNDTTYEVGEGEVFAQRFQVLDIDGACATFLFGDSRFTLCEGESIVK